MNSSPSGFPVETDSIKWPVSGMGTGSSARLREGKFSPDNRPTYATGAMLVLTGKDGQLKTDKLASINVVELPATGATFELGVQYVSEGRVWVQPYEQNGRVTVSITVERFVQVASTAPKLGD